MAKAGLVLQRLGPQYKQMLHLLHALVPAVGSERQTDPSFPNLYISTADNSL